MQVRFEYHLRKISKIRKYLGFKSAETHVHALVTSRLDFCNAMLYGLNNYLERIQKVQNAAARIVTLTRKRGHISPALFKLYWSPMRERIAFKILLLITYKALNGLTPTYISDMLDIYVPMSSEKNISSSNLWFMFL